MIFSRLENRELEKRTNLSVGSSGFISLNPLKTFFFSFSVSEVLMGKIHLNLPTFISFGNNGSIEYIYNAAGQKVKKTVNDTPNNTIKHVHYLDGFQYAGDVLQFFPTAEGYVDVTANETIGGLNYIYNYVFNYTDHLGNIRMSFTKDPVNNELKILEENHYYPFGLKHAVYADGKQKYQLVDNLENTARPTYVYETDYQYKYQGQEYQDELGLNWYSYKYRNYDAAIGRFMSIDPLTEQYNTWSPYVFSGNRVIDARELEGLEPYLITGRTFIPNKTVGNPQASVSRSGIKEFRGDNRTSYKANTTAYRTEQKVRVDFDNNKVTTVSNQKDHVRGLDANGNVVNMADKGKAGPNPTYTKEKMETEGSVTVNMQTEASNDLVVGAPAIDYNFDVSITPLENGSFDFSVTGSTDGYPAYELWITDEQTGCSSLLYGSNPIDGGTSPTALFPPMENNVNVSGNSNDLIATDEVKFGD